MGVTIRDVLNNAVNQLSGHESARLDSEVLLINVIGKEREYVYSHPESPLNEAKLSDFNSLIMKRFSGYPLAYLTGHKEFWSINLTVNKSTLIPRPETEQLVETALTKTPANKELSILDLGTGSGAIAIAFALERPQCSVTAVDISKEALQTARHNAHHNHVQNIKFIKSDWFSELGTNKYDLILCNPPYVETDNADFVSGEIRHEPRVALDGGRLGLHAYQRIIPVALMHLHKSGYLCLEHGNTQGGFIRQLLQRCGFKGMRTEQDYSGHERVTIAGCP